MLSIEKFKLVGNTPNRDEHKLWWTFKHEYNPSKLEIVFMNSKGVYSGNKFLIEKVKELNTENSYIPTKSFIKKRNDLVNRIQSK